MAISARLLENTPRGAGVLAVVPESPQTLVTGGYDTIVRVWDLRSLQWYFDMAIVIFKKFLIDFPEKFSFQRNKDFIYSLF